MRHARVVILMILTLAAAPALAQGLLPHFSLETWLAAEAESRQIMRMPLAGEDQLEIDAALRPLVKLAMEDELAAAVLARLACEHRSRQVSHTAGEILLQKDMPQLKTPLVRQILWDGSDGQLVVSLRERFNAALPLFGPGQLRWLDNDELVVQAREILIGSADHVGDDVIYEMYLLELLRRQVDETNWILDNMPQWTLTPQRMIMRRTAMARLWKLPDPFTVKAVRDLDDPTLVHMELSLTDSTWDKFELSQLAGQDFGLQVIVLGDKGKPGTWVAKWPADTVLKRGQPIRTATSTAIVKGKHRVQVLMATALDAGSIAEAHKLLPGARLMPVSAEIEMSGQ